MIYPQCLFFSYNAWVVTKIQNNGEQYQNEETKNMTNSEYVKHIKEKASKSKVKLPVIKKSTKV